MLSRINQLYHTLRHLKGRQLAGQIFRRLIPFLYNPARFSSYESPPFPGYRTEPTPEVLAAHPGSNSAATLLEGTFVFLNHAIDLQFPPKWSKAKDTQLLWEYNLHYFDWLHLLPFDNAKAVVVDWIRKQLPIEASAAWSPYPTSLRILNWTVYFFINHRSQLDEDEELRLEIWNSLACQASYLARNLETHILGNHLFENIAALAFLGTVIKGETAETWRTQALRELSKEIPEQFLPDGLHFELSPMYHLRMIYLLYLLHTTDHKDLRSIVELPLREGLSALLKTCHPDGQIALLNDSAFNICHTPKDLIRPIFDRLKQRSDFNSEERGLSSEHRGTWALRNAGYYGYQDTEKNYLICDVGPIGPDYIPGHSHADALSFELSLKSCRVIVDTGNFEYVAGNRREYARSTRAHNTIEVNGQDQCDLWGAFRVGHRGYPKELQFSGDDDSFTLSCAHDGYESLRSKTKVKRSFVVTQPFEFRVTDNISSRGSVTIKSFIHLAPHCSIITKERQAAIIHFPKGTFRIQFKGDGQLTSELTRYFPEFGIEQDRTTLCYTVVGVNVTIAYTVQPL